MKKYYAAESSMGLDYTYDSPCWVVLAFKSRRNRDDYVRQHDNVEAVSAKTAKKIIVKNPYRLVFSDVEH